MGAVDWASKVTIVMGDRFADDSPRSAARRIRRQLRERARKDEARRRARVRRGL